MNEMPPVVIIGDGIIDAVQTSDAPPVLYPGGAGLNLAVGLARLGVSSALAARIGSDPNGFRLMRYLREEGVALINTPNVDFTGLVTSLRVDGEPSYHFTPSMYRRRIAFNAALRKAMAEAPLVAVNSFSFEDPAQVAALGDALAKTQGPRILDPNVRPRLVGDLDAFRQGFERTLPRATLVKLSDEDAGLLYGRDDDGIAAALLDRGVEGVLFTRGKSGASVFTRSGIGVSLPATALAAPIVDTMGAGDATLASVIAFILAEGMPGDEQSWRACLKRAMDIAAATCRSAGGALVRPASPISAHPRGSGDPGIKSASA
jgi:fructokinase